MAERASIVRYSRCMKRYLGGLALFGFVLSSALLSAKGCSCAADALPSTVTRDDRGYVVAWASPQDGKSVVYVHRFLDEDFGRDHTQVLSIGPLDEAARENVAGQEPRVVFKDQQLASAAEIARGTSGFLVLARTSRDDLVVATLDSELKVVTRKTAIAREVDAVCPAPAGYGRGYLAAWIERGDGAKRTLRVATLDASGAIVESNDIAVGPGDCALAAVGNRWGVVHRETRGGRVLFAAATRLGPEKPRLIEASHRGSDPLRLVAQGDGWLLLIGHGTDSVRLVSIEDGGGDGKTVLLRGVDPGSIDIGRNSTTSFASWLAAGKVHLATLADDGSESWRGTHPVARDPVGTRAFGHDDRCASTWTSNLGRSVTIVVVGACR